MRQHQAAVAAALFVAALGVRLQTAAPVGAAAQTGSRPEAAALDLHPFTLGHLAASDTAAPIASTTLESSSEGDDPAPGTGSSDGSDALASGGPATSAAGSVESTESLSTRTTASPAPTPAPVSAPTTTPALAPTAITPVTAPATTTVSPSPVEAQVLALINSERARAGVPALRLNSGAMSVARGWASYMAAHTLDHNPNLVGGLAQAGVGDWRSVAENVGQGLSLDQIQATLMASPLHRANLLGAAFSRVGIGVATTGDQVFVALDFIGW